MANGESRIYLGWFFAVISGIVFMATDAQAFGFCCTGLISLIVADSGHNARKRWKSRQIVYVQPAIQQQPVVVHQHHHTTNTIQQPPAKPNSPPVSKEQLMIKAQNLEIARDWQGAAKAYQEAGLYAEAGRIREEHLEKDKDKVVLNIDRIGDTVLNDSVMMNEKNDSQNSNDFEP